MALIYADVCKICHQHKTQHPSGICSHCRRSRGSTVCKLCGKVTTTHQSGICYKCRRSTPDATMDQRIASAIEDTKRTLLILERRQAGDSFATIAKMSGLSKTAVYSRFMRAYNQDAEWGAIDPVDGSYIGFEKESSQKND